MDLGLIIVLIVVAAILLKTGSAGKAIGFVLKYAFFPGLGGLLGMLLGSMIGVPIVGTLIGILIGFVLVIKDGKNKLQ